MAEPLPGYIAADVEVSHKLVERLSAKYGISVDDFQAALISNRIAVVDEATPEESERIKVSILNPKAGVLFIAPSADYGSDWFTEPTRKRLTEIVEPDDA